MDIFDFIFTCISPLANSWFVGVMYLLACISILFGSDMPVILRFSLALPLTITGLLFLFVANSVALNEEQAIMIRLSHLVFMLSLIINGMIYTIFKKRKVG